MKGSSSVSNDFMTAICIGSCSGLEEESQTILGMETKSHWEYVGLCLITHWALINRKKGSSSVSNGLIIAIGIGFGSGLEEESQTIGQFWIKPECDIEQKASKSLLDCV
jgi:hypothetical protein